MEDIWAAPGIMAPSLKQQADSLENSVSTAPVLILSPAPSPRPPDSLVRKALILPLQSFICPITQEVMSDPVQIASGQTYERKAIERWFAEGNTRCPTGIELRNLDIRPNIALKKSISEWEERNNQVRFQMARDVLHLPSEDGEDTKIIKALRDIQALCKEDSLFKYKVASNNLVLPILRLCSATTCAELRRDAFSVLQVLSDNEDCQEALVKENIIEIVVRYLALRNDDTLYSVRLLRTLSSNKKISEIISCAPNAVLFLVTLIRDANCAEDVKAILDKIPKTDENAVIMAEVNILEPLVNRLEEGNMDSKTLMASTLARLHLSDSMKAAISTQRTIDALVEMLSSSSGYERRASVMAIENLSTVAPAVERLRDTHAFYWLFKTLMTTVRNPTEVSQACANILSNAWAALGCSFMTEDQLEEAVKSYFDLLGLSTPVSMLQVLLKGLLHLAQDSSTAGRQKMKHCNAFTSLFRLYVSASKEPNHAALCSLCMDLIACLAAHFHHKAARAFVDQPEAIHHISDLTRDVGNEAELKSALSLLCYLSLEDNGITKMILQEVPEFPQLLLNFLKSGTNERMINLAAGALVRFTAPVDFKMQKMLAREGVMEIYVKILKSGTLMDKERAAKALCNFAMSSRELSQAEMENTGGNGCSLARFLCMRSRSLQGWCVAHGGKCSISETFCIVNAEVIEPLLASLKEESKGLQVTALMTLGTLVMVDKKSSKKESAEIKAMVEAGCLEIEKRDGLSTIIDLMSSSVPQVQELAARLSDRFLSVPRLRALYGSQAQTHIVNLAQQQTSPVLRQLAGRLLRHLGLLQTQSSYFGASSSLKTNASSSQSSQQTKS